MWYGWVLVQTNCHRGIDQHPAEEPGLGVRSIRKTAQIKEIKNMDKSRKKSTVLCAGIFVFLGIWMVLTVPCRAAETDNDEKQSQIIRVGSFEDTPLLMLIKTVSDEVMATSSCRLWQVIPDGNLSM